jgi:hypothetical protein
MRERGRGRGIDSSTVARPLLLVVALAVFGCAECREDSDCARGEKCVGGSCVASGQQDTSTDTLVDGDVVEEDTPDADAPDVTVDTSPDTVVDSPTDAPDAETDAPVPCTVPADCDDGNPCTTDHCHEVALVCVHADADGNLCDDGLWCNGIDTCQGGECVEGEPVTCEDPNPCVVGECDEGAHDCAWEALEDHAFCDNGFFCDGTDECIDGVCTPTYDTVCNDGNPCTHDTCDWDANACSHEPVTLELDTLDCGETTLALLSGSEDRMNNYVCDGSPHPAYTGEVIFRVELSSTVTLQASIGKDEEDPTEFHLYLLTDVCDPTTCVARGGETLNVPGASGTVYIVVERDTVGASWLTVECL